ncbi:PREDICTED: cardiolipin synthase (CMP-forming)-like [Amphimedon queenslandica]|uniref:cardiolipin synthase (CMP-forming) n=2 Tax=Amphimedon queenslandica TaxID=400682 RepID=A0A1X7VLW1_AMPQE|nr:PREDICTED: cardiolipin synthase (CMP-forming)-like [Amphimedon queenslandica]|eukprot:XP_003383767.1 PREDICTED: cardiolipin synthase (CMP-forming)-like [Amphimedon queenslandica]
MATMQCYGIMRRLITSCYYCKCCRVTVRGDQYPSLQLYLHSHSVKYRHVAQYKRHLVRDTSPENRKNIIYEKENIWTIPNLLTTLRIGSAPLLGYLVLNQEYLGAIGVLTVASLSDLLDGFIARRFPSQSSKLGSILDPLADKCLISVLYISLTIVNLIPLPLTFLIISRDLMLVGGSFYLRYVTLPPPRTWRRYWDVERSGLQITPNLLGKANTALQLMLVGITMLSPLLDCIDQQLLKLLWFTVGTTTIASGMSYCVQLKGFQIIKKRHLK